MQIDPCLPRYIFLCVPVDNINNKTFFHFPLSAAVIEIIAVLGCLIKVQKIKFIYPFCSKLFSKCFLCRIAALFFLTYLAWMATLNVCHTAPWCGWKNLPSILWKLPEQGMHADPVLLTHAAGWALFWRDLQAYGSEERFGSTANTNYCIED